MKKIQNIFIYLTSKGVAMQTLILFAHTFWQDSKANKALLESLKDSQEIKVHNLSTTYKHSSEIALDSELALLEKAQNIIFQFPLFWYSTPGMLKDWQDIVLTPIFYKESKMLQGKTFGLVITAGGTEESYDGHHGATIKELLLPLYHSFTHLGLKTKEPFCIFDVDYTENKSDVTKLPFEEYKRYVLD